MSTLLAFKGTFEKLFRMVKSEGSVESRANAGPAPTCVDALLRSNRWAVTLSTFLHLLIRSVELLPRLHFRHPLLPCSIPLDLFLSELAPQQFTLDFWDGLKKIDTSRSGDDGFVQPRESL